MLELAVKEGVSIHRRSPEFADDVVGRSMGETIAHIADSVPGQVVMWSQCTSPLVDEHIYERAIGLYQQALAGGHDSLLTVTRIHEYLWGADAPVNFTPGRGHVPSQQLPELYRATFGILLAPRTSMVQWNYYHGPNPYRMVLSKRESADIDDELDLLCARAWIDAIPELSAINPFDESTESGASPIE
jgi:CMP-N-acetylneuraminic acid synthetase